MACQRFWPEYGIRREGRAIQIPIINPRAEVTAPMPAAQVTIRLHSRPFSRSGVKYSQCGIAPKYAPRREARVVDCTTSPVTSET